MIPTTSQSGPDRAGAAPRRHRRSGGFTILEVMMAATVMAFAITTSITTMQRAFAALDTARNLTIAGQIMVCEMEKIRMLDWTTVSAYPSSATVTIDSSFTSNSKIGNRFTLTRTTATAGSSNMLQITLTISWNNYDGRTLTRSYMTYYARYGIHDYLYNTS